MAVEIGRAYSFQCSQSPLPPPNCGLSAKTLIFSFSYVYHTGRQSPYIAIDLQKSHHTKRASEGRARGRRGTPLFASLDGFVDDDEDQLTNFSSSSSSSSVSCEIYTPFPSSSTEMQEIPLDPCVALLPEKFERRTNCFYLPLSLRILKRKKKRREKNAVINELSSVRKAFSSMVFIVQVLQRHAIRMRANSFSSSNLHKDHNQGILARVHDELHSSFVWLFQHIFSATPTLMVYLMLLLANFTVFSITIYPPTDQQFENPTIGGSSSVVADRSVDGECDRSLSSLRNAESISPEILSKNLGDEEYAMAWKAILQEAERIRANDRHEALSDPDTLRRFVSPVSVVLELEDLSAFRGTELSYRRALAEDPDDPLNLSNFAQFLYLVLRDYDSAEEYFKRAARAELRDADILCRYANFLWVAKQDFSAAEEIFLEAIAMDPGNSYYSANYAHFLWSTGGVDTCYPLDSGDP